MAIENFDKIEYSKWLTDVSKQYKSLQVKASVMVNYSMLQFYWQLGADISAMEGKYKWGSGFYTTISRDLRENIPDVKSFSITNLRYMKYFFQLFSKNGLIHPQVGDEFMAIPWGHIKLIIDKCSDDLKKAEFYVHQVLKNNWSRAVLFNFLDTDLYLRQGKAVSNFQTNLDKITGDLAQEITRDPYNFDFLTIQPQYNERQLKDALMDNIQRFLLELGTGFSFVGREYRLEVGRTEQFIDMLFYHIALHCYVVVEVKIREFEPADMGQISTYVSAVDGLLRKDGDGSTIGILICKNKDNILAKYALAGTAAPIGISEYQLAELLPKSVAEQMPTIEEIENGIK